jgi:phytoene/squalene synthetase
MDLSSLVTLLDARENDLSYPSFATLDQLASFAADVQAPLILAVATAMSGADVCEVDANCVAEASRCAGEAVGLAVLLRGAPAHAKNRLSYVPRDVLRDAGVSASAVLAGDASASRKVFKSIGMRAERSMRLADDAAKESNGRWRQAFWGLELPRIYVARLRKVDWNVFDESLQRRMRQTYPLVLQIRLLARKMMRR